MSKITLSGNASGTGTLTIAAPNTNTDRTLTLPDATGTVQVSGNAISGTTGSFSGDLSFNSGYGSAAVAYGCRAWVNFNGTGTVAIRASGNVTSITDNGTGSYTVNFTTSMPDANFSCVANAINDGVANAVAVPNVSSTGSVLIYTVQTTALTTAADVNKIYAAIFR